MILQMFRIFKLNLFRVFEVRLFAPARQRLLSNSNMFAVSWLGALTRIAFNIEWQSCGAIETRRFYFFGARVLPKYRKQ